MRTAFKWFFRHGYINFELSGLYLAVVSCSVFILIFIFVTEPQNIPKYDFSSRIGPFILISMAPVLLDQSNKTSGGFPALKLKNHFLPPVHSV